MAGNRVGGRGRRIAWGARLLILGVVLYLLARSLHDNDVLEGLDKVFSIIGGMSGLLGLALTVRAVRSVGSPADAHDGQADSSGLDGLATAVEQVWRPELRRRRLANPHPLPIAWTTIGPPIADHWSNIRSDGHPMPLNLDDCLDLRRPDALHQVLTDERLRGRVILLGEPGAGKTTLLLREALRLLRARTSGDRVPVLLRLPTWNPDEQTLEQWITTQLATEYGHRSLITTSHLLPLLDGLDEMPAPRRARAVQAINNTFDPDQPLVLTSRTTEYLDTLAGLPGTTMAAAAVLELTTIAADVACAYLQRTTNRPGDWEAAFDRDTDGRLADALNAPLWIDLARITHTPTNPTDSSTCRTPAPSATICSTGSSQPPIPTHRSQAPQVTPGTAQTPSDTSATSPTTCTAVTPTTSPGGNSSTPFPVPYGSCSGARSGSHSEWRSGSHSDSQSDSHSDSRSGSCSD